MVSMNTTMLINNRSSIAHLNENIEESFDVSWNDILYDGGLATSGPRSSLRWLTVSISIIGIMGKSNSMIQ